MADRRSLVDGLKATSLDRAIEEQFVFADKVKPEHQKVEALPARPVVVEGQGANHSVGRAPLTTRVRADIAASLKRASLERQLAGTVPNTVQDILEEALEPWLRQHGYLS